MKKQFSTVALFMLLLQGCINGIPNVYIIQKNNSIDPQTKSQIDSLNNKLFKAISDSNYTAFYNAVSDTLKNLFTAESNRKIFAQLHYCSKYPRTTFNDYYVKNTTQNSAFSINDGLGSNAFQISFIPLAKEAYISLNTFNDSGAQLMITLVYYKQKERWSVNIIEAFEYSLNYKTAPQFYEEAKSLYNNNDLIDAINTIDLCRVCEHPCKNFLAYKIQDSIDAFATKIKQEANKKFPLPMHLPLLTRPSIYSIQYQIYFHSIVPTVTYHTEVSIKDTVALKQENAMLQSYVKNTFPAFCKYHDLILSKAYNVIPGNRNDTPLYYQFVWKKG